MCDAFHPDAVLVRTDPPESDHAGWRIYFCPECQLEFQLPPVQDEDPFERFAREYGFESNKLFFDELGAEKFIQQMQRYGKSFDDERGTFRGLRMGDFRMEAIPAETQFAWDEGGVRKVDPKAERIQRVDRLRRTPRRWEA